MSTSVAATVSASRASAVCAAWVAPCRKSPIMVTPVTATLASATRTARATIRPARVEGATAALGPTDGPAPTVTAGPASRLDRISDTAHRPQLNDVPELGAQLGDVDVGGPG